MYINHSIIQLNRDIVNVAGMHVYISYDIIIINL